MSESIQTPRIAVRPEPEPDCVHRALKRILARLQEIPPREGSERFTICPLHADPTAAIVIGCSDHVYFRVHPWSLRRTSGFFADLLDSSDKPVLINTPIELPAGYVAVITFLNAAFTGSLAVSKCITFEDIQEGIDLANFLRAPSMEQGYLITLRDSKIPASRSWDCFVLAAQKGNLSLARVSIKAFSTAGSDHPAMQLPFLAKEAEKVPLDWMQELMRRRIKQEPANERAPGRRYSEVPWATVAEMFMSGKPVGDPVSKVSTPNSVKKK